MPCSRYLRCAESENARRNCPSAIYRPLFSIRFVVATCGSLLAEMRSQTI